MFKDNFVRLCNKKGVSPSSVLTKCGMNPTTYSCWTDQTVPRRSTLLRLADYLGCTVEELLSESADSPVKNEKTPPAEAEGDMSQYLVNVLEAARAVPPDKREEFLSTVEAIANMCGRRK